MKFIAGLSSLLVPVCVMLFLSLIRISADKASKKMNDNDFCIQIPKAVFALGLICALLFVGLACYVIFASGEDFSTVVVASIVFGLFSSLGVYLMVYTLAHKVIVNDNVITVFSVFRKPYSFSFDDIVLAKRKILGQNEKITVKTNLGKKFSVEMGESAYERFAEAIKVKVKSDRLIGF